MASQHQTSTQDFPVISYRRSGKGPALMLLHGFPANGSLWDPVVESLSQNCTLLIPDLPGTGASQPGGTITSIEQLAEIVPAILKDGGIERCVIAGHSMGGYVALAALENYPGNIQGIALVHSSAAADDDAKKKKRAKSIALIDNGGREPFIRGMIPALFAPGFDEHNKETVAHWTSEGLKLPAETLTAFYRAMMERPARTATLQQASVPVLFILGAEDSTIPWQSVLHQTTLPDVSIIEKYAGTGHMGMIENSGKLALDLSSFVRYSQQVTQ